MVYTNALGFDILGIYHKRRDLTMESKTTWFALVLVLKLMMTSRMTFFRLLLPSESNVNNDNVLCFSFSLLRVTGIVSFPVM